MKGYFGIYAIALVFITISADELGKVKITPDVAERFVKPGDSLLNVECSVSAKQGQKQYFGWVRPSVNGITIKKRTEVVNNVTQYFDSLTIENIKPEHMREYKCTYGASSASFTLRYPTEDKVTANYTHGEEKDAVLSCSISGAAASKQITKMEWLKNDTLISELSDKDRFTELAANNTLIISKPTRQDADLYVARFYFEDMKFPYDCDVPFIASPLVLNFDKSKNLIEDDTMELQCKVKGYPRATVTWLKNEKPLNLTDSLRVVQSPLDGYVNARLVIKSVQFEDAGEYTCLAHSDYFNVSVSKTLVVRVKDKLAALWPFLGIVGEVVVLCVIIFIYEKRRNKQAENEANEQQDVDGSISDKKEGLRHRNTQSNNPTA